MTEQRPRRRAVPQVRPEPKGETSPADPGPQRKPGEAEARPAGSGPAAGTGFDLARQALSQARAQRAEREAAARRSRASSDSPLASNNPKAKRSAKALSRRRWSTPGKDFARDPAPLGATMRHWVQQAGVGADLDKANIFGRWSDIVGPDLAARCRPVSLVDGLLTLQAESTAWATNLQLMAAQLVKTVNTAVGHGSVLRIRAHGPAGPSWRFGTRHVPGRGPRDTYG